MLLGLLRCSGLISRARFLFPRKMRSEQHHRKIFDYNGCSQIVYLTWLRWTHSLKGNLMPTYAAVPTMEEIGFDGNLHERFVTDERPTDVTDNVTRRMMSPKDCLDKLVARASSRQDLLVEGTKGLNLTADANSNTLFSIKPEVNGGLGDWCKRHGSIPLSPRAVNQLCSLMGVKGGYKRYTKMGSNGPRHFLADFESMFRFKRMDDPNLIFRTIHRGTGMEVEGILPDNIDRTDSQLFVSTAMKGIMERFGDCIRGVEVFDSMSQGGMEFRILFGNPIMQELEMEPTKRLYTMLNISTSDTRTFSPRASLGVWRMWCANGCTRQQFDMASFRMNRSSTFEQMSASLDSMASIAFPYAGLIGHSLQSLQTRQIGNGDRTAYDVLGMLRDRGEINDDFYDRCHDLGKGAYADDELKTEWDMFNLWTDAAKGLGSMSTRRNAEDKALTLAMSDGGFSGVAERGFNRKQFESDMSERVKGFVMPNAEHNKVLLESYSQN